MTSLAAHIEHAFKAEERFLWGLCYRLTGSAADADDLVQDTFVRALERPPPRSDEPWRPWLVRVALNLGRDVLRRRKRRAYVGPWLPAAIETGDEASLPAVELTLADGATTEGRYDLLESVSYAFLVALEALTPQQRAVLLLRDVFDYPVADTAAALDISDANVKTTLHRARRAMVAYDRQRCVPTRSLQQRTRDVLQRFLASLAAQDVAAIESLLAADVRAYSDGGAEFAAARRIVRGRRNVRRLYAGLARKRGAIRSMPMRLVNGLPAFLIAFDEAVRPHIATRLLLTCDLDPDGRIRGLYSVLASDKLRAVRFTE
jgi:RNA polymerase sigma-70 factor (ECF subfamily)